jgi:hypothetical protein
MPTKSPFTSSVHASVAHDRDGELMAITRSLIDSAAREWPDRLVAEPNGKGSPAQLYTETHFALAAVLLFVGGDDDRALLDLAAHRLRLWDAAGGPMFAFNAMAVCLTAIVLRRSGETHGALESVLGGLLARTREYRHDVYRMNCGNNAYLQQVAVDTVLLPLARQQTVTADGVNCLVAEFQRYRTPEGFFYDLPRRGNGQERLCPPTYIMKMLFLAGICHELHPAPAVAGLFASGMVAALPLFTREGLFAYFGRTDNSPFAAGLTIFNLRKAAHLVPESRRSFDGISAAAERYYAAFPRTPAGLLLCNRFGNPDSPAEYGRSHDDYAYVGQYSLASAAYALLGSCWFPAPFEPRPAEAAHVGRTSIAVSRDLGLVKIDAPGSELILRTTSQATSLDRRYLGPTILRFEHRSRLVVGAISRTISTDAALRPRAGGRIARAWQFFRDRFAGGIEQLDGCAVGFLPVVRSGAVDYLPYRVVAQEASAHHVRTRYEMVRLHARGLRPCLTAAMEQVRQKVPLPSQRHDGRPRIRSAPSLQLQRDVYVTAEGCRIEDRVSGDLRGKRLLFSVRSLPGATVTVRGLHELRWADGWGSDGRQRVTTYSGAATGPELRYECDIAAADRH